VEQTEAHFDMFGDSFNLGATMGMEIAFGTPNGTPM
jgi:hypothetical protein